MDQHLQQHLGAVQAIGARDADDMARSMSDWRYRAASIHIGKKAKNTGRLQWPKDMFPVELRRSDVHGRGIFATRDVRAGDLLTLYPTDAQVSYRSGGEGIYVLLGPSNPKTCEEVYEIHQEYGAVLGSHIGVVLQAVGFPELVDDPAYLGHLANDACIAPDARLGASAYDQGVGNRVNASFAIIQSELHHCIVAITPIAKGSEILVRYGAEYWQAQRDRR